MIVNSYNGFVFDDGLGAAGQFSRGPRLRVYNLDERQILSLVVQHFPGETIAASRQSVKIIEFQGHVFGNPEQTEWRMAKNIDTLLTYFNSGLQPLCVHDDGRYYMAELYSCEFTIVPGDTWHTRYQARFWCGDPWSYSPNTITWTHYAPNTPMSFQNTTLYAVDFTSAIPGPLPLGTAPSSPTVTVTFQQSNSCFMLRLNDTNTFTPRSSWVFNAPNGVFANGDVVSFNSADQRVYYNGTAIVQADHVQQPLVLDPNNGQIQTSRVYARANGGAPKISLVEVTTARYY